MKKILLATSALVAMSSVALAGGMVDTPAAPAPVAEGFTFTASGEADLFAFYTQNTTTTPSVKTNGFGGDLDFNFKASRTFDDGGELTVEVDVDTNKGTGADVGFDIVEVEDFIIGYKSAMGTLQIGSVKVDGHDVEIPEAPSIFVFESDDDEDDFLDIITADKISILSLAGQREIRAGRVVDELFKNMAMTYASPTFGGFQLGLGVAKGAVAGDVKFDAVVAGAVSTGNVDVKVGAGYAADSANAGKGIASFGASATTMGFTLGGNVKHNLALATNKTGFEVGAQYAADDYRIGAKYTVAAGTAPEKGKAVVGARYTMGDTLEAAASVGYNLALTTNKVDVYAGVVYNSDDFDASVQYQSKAGGKVEEGVVKAGVAVKAIENLELTVSGSYDLLSKNVTSLAGLEYQATSALKLIAGAGFDRTGATPAVNTVKAKLGVEYAVTSKWTVDAAGMYSKVGTAAASFGGEAGASYEFAEDVTFDLKGSYDDASKTFGAKAGFSVEF